MTGRCGRAGAAIALAALLAALPACTPLYLPPVPGEAARGEIAASEDPLELLAGELRVDDPGLRLELRVARPERPGYLAVQWFDPSLQERAAQSVWLEASGAADVRLVVATPSDLALRPGRWRALVSAEGVPLRQFSVVVPGT